jgi:hypothetical protein
MAHGFDGLDTDKICLGNVKNIQIRAVRRCGLIRSIRVLFNYQ